MATKLNLKKVGKLVFNVVAIALLVAAYSAEGSTVTSNKLDTNPTNPVLRVNKLDTASLTQKSISPSKPVKKPAKLTQRSRVPAEEAKYRSYLIRESRRQAGMEAPTSMWAGQIHQESAWRANAKSAYASGLTQFTPDTEKWIIGLFPQLGKEGVQDPMWAIRAMITYDLYLKQKVKSSKECDDWAKALAAYNGGLGWIYRDEKLAAAAGKDPLLWWNNTDQFSKGAPQFIKENRDYPIKILLKHQPLYLSTGWYGQSTVCGEKL